MNKNWLVRTNQTITFLPMIIVLFIGLVGYAWLRTELVGSWVLFIALILLGRFFNLLQASIIAIFTFIIVFIYILFDIQSNTFDMSIKLLQLFILPVAPLFLSIYYEIMSSNKLTDRSLDAYRKHLIHKILPISAYTHTHAQIQQMFDQKLIESYAEIHIEITNHELLRDMLQVNEFKIIQQNIIDVLNIDYGLPHFYFADARLSILRMIMIIDQDLSKLQQLSEKIKDINLIKTKISIITHGVESSSADNLL